MMNRYFRLSILILSGLILFWVAFLTGCSRSGQIYPDDTINILQGERYSRAIPAKTCADGSGSNCTESSSRESRYNLIIPGRATKSAEFIPGKKLTISLEGASLEVPATGMKENRVISVTGLLAEDLPPIPPEITSVTAGYYAGYRFLPHGRLFDSALTIALPYDKSLIPSGYSSDDIFTFWFDEAEKKWKALDRDTVDNNQTLIISATTHFTDMINGIITIPESPETSGYVPTSMNDIRVAEPSAGINLIEPPVANNEGDASLVFPFKIPEGRTGLQPQLTLMYSSDLGSGWAGYGWDISLPAVSVDLTWGVPRYLPDKESETYLFKGSQLSPVAHRGDYIDRVPEKRFYSRRESDFSKIIRHGDGPTNYWWEITTKEGIRNYYGGTPTEGIDENAISLDPNGYIGYWALVETRDLHENFIRYKYEKTAESDQEIYIGEITYTGHGTVEGAYKISFLQIDEGNDYERRDSRVDARSGFIKRDNKLLRRINITYNDEAVRSYTFHYKDGEFMKSLLSGVTEINSAGDEFYTHSFSYYNDVQSGGKYVPYGPDKEKILPDDKLKEPLLNPINFFFDNVSALGGSASTGISGGTSLTVGLLDGNLATKDNTAGGNFTYQSSDNEGFLSFIDLNGDGLPDKVYKKNNKVYYRPNLLSYPNENIFGDEKFVNGISRISYSKTRGFSGGVEANPLKAFAGAETGSTTTKTGVYFTDFNGDGLTDLASNGVVFFNHINENGVPVFSESSNTTPNPLFANSEIAPYILPDPKEEQAQLEAQFPLHDAVRLWKAPFDGLIIINAPVQLAEDKSSVSYGDKYKDGVKVSIQHNSDNPFWMMGIDSGNYTLFPGPAPNPINVNKGDRFYFRVQSRFNGSCDKVYWDPEIKYQTINNSDTLVDLEDSNRKIVGRYKASEDFVLCGQQSVGLPKDGQVRIRATFSKAATSDSLELFINYTDSAGYKSEIYHSSYTCEAKNNDPIDRYYDIIRNGFLQFSIVSSTSVDWSAIRFSPVIEYTRIDNDSVPVTGPDGEPILRFVAIPEFVKMYNDPVRQELPVIANNSFIKSFQPDSIDVGLYNMKITPCLTGISNADPDSTVNVILAVKQRDKILGEKEYHYLNGSLLTQDTLITTVHKGDTLFLEYNFPDNGLLTAADTTFIIIGSDSANVLKASAFGPADPRDGIFGSMYRGWGQFDFKGDSLRALSPIEESLLKMKDYSGVDATVDTSSLGSIQNPFGDVFNIMIPYAETGYYTGTDNEVYVSPDYISSSRLGENNVLVEPVVFPASGLSAVTKILKNSTKSVGGGFSFASYSHSWGNDNITLDMMDMNGDMYPDLLSTNSIQYTDVRGVLSGPAVNHGAGDHYSKSEAWGITGGGNFANAKAANSLTPITARGTKANTGSNFKTNNNAREAEETSLAASAHAGFTSGEDHTDQTWLDINGDGLPDKVYNNGQVKLNLGYSFAPAETWNFDAICTGKSIDLSGGLGIDISNGSIVAGVSISKSFNYATETFLDINADRLPDLVKGDKVYFNTGSGFASPVDWSGFSGSWPGSLPVQLVGAIPLEAGESIGQAANAGFTVGIGIPIIMIKICINPSGSTNHGISRTLTQLADIDGDGMPDILSSGSENKMKIKLSTIFRTNMLKTVERPLGGSFTLDYLVTPALYDHPGGKLAMASVRMFDGLKGDGVDTTFTSFEYEGGYYDRHERQFLGFSTVRTKMYDTENNSIYRSLIQSFSNRDYYSKGKILSETLVDGSGRKQKGSENFYSIKDIHGGQSAPGDREPAFFALSETKKYTFEGSSEPRMTTRETFDYDTLGNISTYADYSSGNVNDFYSVSIEYHGNPGKYLYSIPSMQQVSTNEGLKRKSRTIIDEFGDIKQISRFISAERAAQFDMEYDEFGNLTKITRPPNHKGERMWFKYEYDDAVHTYINRVTDAYGYSSSSINDYRWGLPVESTDMNNQKIKYSYDESGRLDTVTGPFELASGRPYTMVFEYFPDADVPNAHTMHYDSVYDSNIETYSFSDGLGRMVQTKKTALLFDNAATDDRSGLIVSGRVLYDAFSRPVASYQAVFESAGNPGKYNSIPDIVNPTLLEYDVQNRIKRVILPDGSITTHGYNVGYNEGEMVLKDSLADALKNITITFIKANGRQAATARKTAEEEIYTSYRYNGVGELINVTDPRGNISKSGYDMLGRRLSFEQADAGLTEFRYDDAGNLTGKITASLRKQIPEGGAITYKYDHERLVEIVYPRNIQNRVNYTYGEPGASFNRAGRIVLVQDAGGGQEFFYGKLGEIVKTIRTIQIDESDMRTWIWSAEYDTWNRVHTMTYPDGEKVIYSYNRAGNLLGMKGEKLGRSYDYISRLGYNKYEKQVYLKYGNGAETTSEYEPKLQRLKQMNVQSKNQAIMVNEYSYDFMGNILGITNNTSPAGQIGGSTRHSYSYDELYRLTEASGEFKGKNTSQNYSLSMKYDIMGNILLKEQTQAKDGDNQVTGTYSLPYKYEGLQPNAATSIGEKVFTYDANGNPTGWQDTVNNDYRQLAWDEENRLTLISDNGYISRYVYDASGSRVIKSHGGTQGVYINGAPAGLVNSTPGNYTVYVSPYFAFSNEKFTKHYYNGLTRVASKTGNGEWVNQFRPAVFELTAGGINYIDRQQQLESDRRNYVKASGVPPGPPTMKGIYTDPLNTGTAYPLAGTPDAGVPRGWPKQPVFAPLGSPPGAPVQWGDEVTNDNVKPGFGYLGSGNFEEILCYFYHSDQLGSTSYITSASGEITQFISYLPYGEVFTEQHSGWDSPNKFNAKELDTETGLYYYGARYYDPKTARWISPDPFAEKYPEISPYVYCSNNPVIYSDPDGKEITFPNTGNVITIKLTGKLVNNTGKEYSPAEMQSYADRMIASIQTSYTGSEGMLWWKKSWKMEAHITVATEENPLSADDHKFEIVKIGEIPTGTDSPRFAGEDAKGRAPIGGKVIYISEDILPNRPATTGQYSGTGKTDTGNPTLERTAAHEFGHSAGLDHDYSQPGNIMIPTATDWIQPGMKSYKGQISRMQSKKQMNELNQSDKR